MNDTNLLQFDSKTTEKIRGLNFPPFIKKIMPILAHSADSWYWGAGLTAAWFLGPISWRADIPTLLIGIIITAIFVQGLKFIIKRPRPEGEWGQIYRRSDPHSFPSGHAARATMLTVVMFMLGHFWVGMIMIFWTLLVDISRISLGVHYLSDILGGTAIGVVFGVLVVLLI